MHRHAREGPNLYNLHNLYLVPLSSINDRPLRPPPPLEKAARAHETLCLRVRTVCGLTRGTTTTTAHRRLCPPVKTTAVLLHTNLPAFFSLVFFCFFFFLFLPFSSFRLLLLYLLATAAATVTITASRKEDEAHQSSALYRTGPGHRVAHGARTGRRGRRRCKLRNEHGESARRRAGCSLPPQHGGDCLLMMVCATSAAGTVAGDAAAAQPTHFIITRCRQHCHVAHADAHLVSPDSLHGFSWGVEGSIGVANSGDDSLPLHPMPFLFFFSFFPLDKMHPNLTFQLANALSRH